MIQESFELEAAQTSGILYGVDLSQPWALIRSPIDMEVLVALRGTTLPLTGREVARLVKHGSQSSVNAALRRLAQEGVITAQPAGNAYIYTFNREHLAAPAIEQLASIGSTLQQRIRDQISRWRIAPVHASVFGSFARGDADAASDVDLFVVRPQGVPEDDPEWRRQLEELSAHVHAWTGNHVGLSELSTGDARRLRRERPPIVEELRRDAITVAGPEAAKLAGLK